MLAVADGDRLIAQHTLEALAQAIAPHRLRVYIIDDATESGVGAALVEALPGLGVELGGQHRYDRPTGRRGHVERTCRALHLAATDPTPPDLVVKVDPDSLPIGQEIGRTLQRIHQQGGRALWGVSHTMRYRDRLLVLADMLPMGFRRAMEDGRPVDRWSLSRARPVWWSDIGRRALRNGFRFRMFPGGFYVLTAELLRWLSEAGYLDRPGRIGRHGFVAAQEDMMVSILAYAAGAQLHDLNESWPNWAIMNLPPSATAQEIRERGYHLVHPLKAKPHDLRVRAELTPSTTTPILPESSDEGEGKKAANDAPAPASLASPGD